MNLPRMHSMHVVREVPRERQAFNITLAQQHLGRPQNARGRQ